MSMYDDFITRGDSVIYFDTDRRILVDPHNTMAPLPAVNYPWFSTRYPVKVVLQPITEGAPSAIAQTPCRMRITRGRSVLGDITVVGSYRLVCVIPRMDVTPGTVDVEVYDGLENTILAFRTTVVDAIPERPSRLPIIFSNPNSERTNNSGERVINQPADRAIRLQRDPSAFIVGLEPGNDTYEIKLDLCSLPLGVYNAANRLVVRCHDQVTITSLDASLSTDTLTAGWHEGKITVMPDNTVVITF